MAKRVASGVEVRIRFGGPAFTNPELYLTTYQLDDDADSSIVGYNPAGIPSGAAARHTLTAGELSGTLQAFLDSIKADIHTTEGIV